MPAAKKGRYTIGSGKGRVGTKDFITEFLHPDGEPPELTFAGKGAPEDFNMMRPPDVIGKQAPEGVSGMLGSGGGGHGAARF